MSHGHGPSLWAPHSVFHQHGAFGRLFPNLPPFAEDTPQVRNQLKELGKAGGRMDAQDDLSDPILSITDATLSAGNPNNPELTAGMTFLGQFLDHDQTFDPTSSLARRQDPESIRNFRIPRFDLDSVYGAGPTASPHLYDQRVDGGRTTLLVEEIPGAAALSVGGLGRFDLPRNAQGTALLGDPRNDENLIVSQLHVALIKFHNQMVADVKDDLGSGASSTEVFAEAQRLTRWHYQWIILHEFLEGLVGEPVVSDVVEHGRRHYHWRNEPYIPVEYSVAAFRFGHSQVRPSYRANFGPDAAVAATQFFAFIFDPSLDPTAPDPADLRGGKRAARRFLDWQTFFDFGDGHARPNKKIDVTLSSVLFALMGQPAGEPVSLAQRNLLRNLTMGVPSGQRVAHAMGLPVLSESELDTGAKRLNRSTPLWFYVLREAEVAEDGERLGPVGGRIVAEVMVGLLQGDSDSYLNQDPFWTPTVGNAGKNFGVVDLLRAADVVAPVPSR